ncbi:MAG: hypothetical protein FWH34_07985 [Desulfovibrionaceae bacterium]|nr:hypothetical protein [Desulfovibrionaceae bacterium]
MSITKKDCIGLLRQQGASELDATQTVDALLEQKSRLAAAGKLERGTADLEAAIQTDFDAARYEAAQRRRQTAISVPTCIKKALRSGKGRSPVIPAKESLALFRAKAENNLILLHRCVKSTPTCR